MEYGRDIIEGLYDLKALDTAKFTVSRRVGVYMLFDGFE